jgi:ComF family protein
MAVLRHKWCMANGVCDDAISTDPKLQDVILHRAKAMLRPIVDYALPPRCPGCGVIVADDRQFCLDCWASLSFLDGPCCVACSIPLPAALPGMDMQCGACLAKPPPFSGAPAALAYGAIARTVALRLKYGRRLGHARLMAGLMVRHMPEPASDCALLLIPVPLHRWRIWTRGFNQAALIADHLSRLSQVPHDRTLLVRRKATASLRGMNRREREKTVAGAFALAAGGKERLLGQHIVLIDDVHASGATLRACAKLLQRGGAARVTALTWARVVPDVEANGNKFDFSTLDSDRVTAELTG